MSHIIQRQYLHVEFNGTESQSLALQNRLSGWCQEELAPTLERVFNRCVPVDAHWSIGRFDIDIGGLSFDRLEQDLPGLVEKSIEQSLRNRMPVKTSLPDVTLRDTLVQTSTQQHLMQALIYFLRNGSLPWTFSLPAGRHLEQSLSDAWPESSLSSADELRPVLASSNARKRLVRQFSEAFLMNLLKRMAPGYSKTLTGILQTLRNSGMPTDTVAPFVAQLWETAFALVPTDSHCNEGAVVSSAWQNLAAGQAHRAHLASLLERHWPGSTDLGGFSSASRTSLESMKPAGQLPAETGIAPPVAALPLAEDIANPSPVAVLTFEEKHPEATEGIYIDNAGLVILHPFLPQFFSALDIVENDRLVRPDRALCLLHFLNTGQTIAPEYELVLPKVLCNRPLTMSVESDVALTRAELEEAEALLQAVIRHWSALKSTGIDGFRGAFLQRPGKIVRRDDGDWLLQVENRGQDILLEQLPWGIGAIRLPWMASMLWVEWTV